MRLDIMKGLQAPFQGQNWVMKLFIGTILILTSPFIIPAVIFTGYCLSVLRDAANGNSESLPEFDPAGQGMAGLIVMGGLLLMNLIPGGIIAFGVGSVVMTVMSAGVLDPDVFLAALTGAGALSFGCIAVGGLLMFIISFFAPALIMRYALTKDVSSLFAIGQAVSDIKASPIDYLVIFLLPNVLGFAFSVFASMTFGIGSVLIFTFSAATGIITSRLMGDYYRLCLN